MADTDWREILSYSQKELIETDKDKLCESLSWMEADDIELNFTDLKTLFRLAQDILKYKSEQVNNLLGQIEINQRKYDKSKSKGQIIDSPNRSVDNVLETITHQEEVIKTNKEILEQLYTDIAELEGRKKEIKAEMNNLDKDSESSRDVLSEINTMAQLENEITMKNRHIRKLLSDIKILDEENTKLKAKVSVLKDKLTEATKLIENLTEQLLTLNNESNQLKEILGQSEEAKALLSSEVESFRKKLFEKDNNKDKTYEEIKSKAQHWRNIARSKKAEIEMLSNENMKLKGLIIQVAQPSTPQKELPEEDLAKEFKIKELQEKLLEASNKITQSANVIDLLRTENRQLKLTMEEVPESVSEIKNESDDGKERVMINKLKRKIRNLTVSLQEAEEMLAIREKELTEITSQLQMVQSNESINVLLQEMKNKKRQLKSKDDGIKSLVQEINNINQIVDDLQLENEVLRTKINIPRNEKIPLHGIMKKYQIIEENYTKLDREFKTIENKLVSVEMDNHNLKSKICKLIKVLNNLGYDDDKINHIYDSSDSEAIPVSREKDVTQKTTSDDNINFVSSIKDEEMQAIVEENEALRKGLEDILNFLKDNSTTTSGILKLECPSLDAVLRSMEARHTAGWYAPHMATVMELRAALGGKDALLIALHEARKETYDIMAQLAIETQKSTDLEQKIHEIESTKESQDKIDIIKDKKVDTRDFGSWVSENEQMNIDFLEAQIDTILSKNNGLYDDQLKKALIYFHNKFKNIFDKMTSIAIQTSDDLNKWALQEEQYKTEIENLKAQLSQKDDEDISDISPGLIDSPSIGYIQRKCLYLEESYKYIRTLNENMKNEILENKKDFMIATSDFEYQIQGLILSVINLIDRLRSTIPVELFWQQNIILNEITVKYRKLMENGVRKNNEFENLFKSLEDIKHDIMNTFKEKLPQINSENNKEQQLSNIEQSILQKQLHEMCNEIKNKNMRIEELEDQNAKLQETQAKLIDENLSAMTKEEINILKNQLQKVVDDNMLLKQQCQYIGKQLDVTLLQIQDSQYRYINKDTEINMLRHQILDLQSTGDNKAIIARLSGEVLVAHLQALESNKKIERLISALNKEKQSKLEAEEMLKARQKIYDVYTSRYESKFRYMYEVLQTLRQQYQGSLPLASIENYLNNIDDLSHKTYAVNEKLSEIEDLQSNLITKYTIFDQILDVSKSKCLELQDSCPHKLKMIVLERTKSHEIDHLNTKNRMLEQSRRHLFKRCSNLEKNLLLLNQGFEKSNLYESIVKQKLGETGNDSNLEVEDIHSDDENTRKSQTITLPRPKVLRPSEETSNITYNISQDSVPSNLQEYSIKTDIEKREVVHVLVQTSCTENENKTKSVQTDEDKVLVSLNYQLNSLKNDKDKKNNELTEALSLIHQKTEDIQKLNSQKFNLESTIQTLKDANLEKEKQIQKLHNALEDLKQQLNNDKSINIAEINKIKDIANEDNKSLLVTIKQLENEKSNLIDEYKELLRNERKEYSKTMKDMNVKIMELQTQLDRKASDSNGSNTEALKGFVTKYTSKINDLEDKCFNLQSELDGCKTELLTNNSELDRWKQLASERLIKMEQLNSQLDKRHCHEVEAYKAENQHWLSQIHETQQVYLELRARLTEQKTLHVKQMVEKNSQIKQLQTIIHDLKAQILNMQTMISVNDPTFDLSAIVEVEESSDVLSQHGSDRLELKFDSTIDLGDFQDHMMRMPATSTAIWQEPLIDRLRREKQLTSKQNVILRRQIKALAAREKRARLDAQNLKSQIMRISRGGKAVSVETAALQNKIASLQTELSNARKDTHSSIALWDKWKRAQQAADRWQSRYEEKFQEAKKLESNLNLAKSMVNRLEKEKRILLARLSEVKNESLLAIEKQESEVLEKSMKSSHECTCTGEPGAIGIDGATPNAAALLARVEAQQRRIVALEVAEKGNEFLVAEYEKALAEITSLKGQVLKLESTLLESQIRTPLKTVNDHQPELDYWKSYCEMLKEENVQLTLRANALESTPTSAHQSRVNDLEQTVLTLRGLVSKLQAEQKSSTVSKRADSRPSSVRSTTDKGRTQLESLRIEIANLKRSILDKDLLLEKSKEMLKIAAEREDELLRENAMLRCRIDELTRPKGGFLSA
ncbi:centrosomal protein of 290 kDa-like isoform X2 [Galleria mellonella]|uniref:Centrosomal protein of 290 kDa-like isoform X2 n=1 Tax=Galleria mellonella TaxID=7137 RepID=A0ABM3MCU2_GALME|nr:centrosomal protein of 290 kDa-like isoform X2 [Galleria mellonella]